MSATLSPSEAQMLAKAIKEERTAITRRLHAQTCAPAYWEIESHRVDDYGIVDALIRWLEERATR